MLGKLLLPQILEKVENLDNTVFSYIPNTAEVAYFGLMEGLTEHYNRLKFERITALPDFEGENRKKLEEILSHNARSEKLAIKDIKMRTFIAEGSSRKDMAAHVYDITYNSIRPNTDSIAIIDDSIVRGTTLKESIIKILSRLEPKEIIILSSSPQIRYPDCYGIDMSRMSEFIAFNAAIALIKERGMEHILKEVYDKCKADVEKPLEDFVSTGNVEDGQKVPYIENYVKEIYAPFTDEEICSKIAELVTPEDVKCKVKIIFQSIENLHKACSANNGDWYFSGDYPTPGGTRTAIRAYINYFEGNPYKRGYSR